MQKELVPKKLLYQAGPCSAGPPPLPQVTPLKGLCVNKGAPPQLHPLSSSPAEGRQTQAHGRVSLSKALGRGTHLPALLSKNVLNIDQTQGENKILQDREGVGLGVKGEGSSFFPNYLVDCN